jgi:hypothetical protein
MKKFNSSKWITENKHGKPINSNMIKILSECLMEEHLPKNLIKENLSSKLKEGFEDNVKNKFSKESLQSLEQLKKDFGGEENFKKALNNVKDDLKKLDQVKNPLFQKAIHDDVFNTSKQVKEAEGEPTTFKGDTKTGSDTGEFGGAAPGQRSEIFIDPQEYKDLGTISNVQSLLKVVNTGLSQGKGQKFTWNGEEGFAFLPGAPPTDLGSPNWKIVKKTDPEFEKRITSLKRNNLRPGDGVLFVVDKEENLVELKKGKQYIFVPHISSSKSEAIAYSTIQEFSPLLSQEAKLAAQAAEEFNKTSEESAKAAGKDPKSSDWKSKFFGLTMAAMMLFNIGGKAYTEYASADKEDIKTTEYVQDIQQDVKKSTDLELDNNLEPTTDLQTQDALENSEENPTQFFNLLNSLDGFNAVGEKIGDGDKKDVSYHADERGEASDWSPDEIQKLIDLLKAELPEGKLSGTLIVDLVSLVSNTGPGYNDANTGGGLYDLRFNKVSNAFDTLKSELEKDPNFENVEIQSNKLDVNPTDQKEHMQDGGDSPNQGGVMVVDTSDLKGEQDTETQPEPGPDQKAAFIRTGMPAGGATVNIKSVIQVLKSVNRKSQIAILLKTINPGSNIYNMIRNDEVAKTLVSINHQKDNASITETEFFKLAGVKGDIKPKNPQLIELAQLIIALEKEKSNSIRKMINQSFGKEVLLPAAKVTQTSPGAARKSQFKQGFAEHLFVEYLNNIQEGVVSNLLPKFIEQSQIDKEKLNILAVLGSMHAAEGSTKDKTLPTVQFDILSSIDKNAENELKKMGFDASSLGLGKKYKFMSDVEKINKKIETNTNLKNLLYKIDTQAELQNFLERIVDYIKDQFVANKSQVKSTFFKLRNQLKEEEPKDINNIYAAIEKDKTFQDMLDKIDRVDEFQQLISGALLPFTKIYARWKGLPPEFKGKEEDQVAKKQIRSAIIAAGNTFTNR